MAEAAAVVGLISSIVTLVDLGAKVLSRIKDFAATSSDVPKSFQSLTDRLPLLIQTVQRIRARAQAGHVPDNVVQDLDMLISSINSQTGFLDECLRKITPARDASRLERDVKGLQSLTKDEKVAQAVEKIHNGIDVLVLHQTTTNVDLSDRILQTLTGMNLDSSTVQQTFGLRLDRAPQIEPDAFMGRAIELQQLHDWLSPGNDTQTQKVVSIVGMGGLGKTQLSLAYVRLHGRQYSSVFWLNAKDSSSLRQSMLIASSVIFADLVNSPGGAENDNVQIEKVRHWLSEPWNDRWLLIFDNYDDPALPNIRSQTGFDSRTFFPSRAQGSILITTRSPKLTFSKRLMLQKLDDIQLGVTILSQRSAQNLDGDEDAQRLAIRLDGLPLALATAGMYLGETGSSCAEYLQMYEGLWDDLHGPGSESLLEYADRTLSSTWTISLEQVSKNDADAARLLRFFALLSNGDIWYDYFKRVPKVDQTGSRE